MKEVKNIDYGLEKIFQGAQDFLPLLGTDYVCLLYTSDAADEGLGVDLGGRRIIKKKIKEGSVEVVGVFVF